MEYSTGNIETETIWSKVYEADSFLLSEQRYYGSTNDNVITLEGNTLKGGYRRPGVASSQRNLTIFSANNSVIIKGMEGDDVFKVTSLYAMNTTIEGGSGIDVLDFSGYKGTAKLVFEVQSDNSIKVNLGGKTLIAKGIEKIIGSSKEDIVSFVKKDVSMSFVLEGNQIKANEGNSLLLSLSNIEYLVGTQKSDQFIIKKGTAGITIDGNSNQYLSDIDTIDLSDWEDRKSVV